MNFNYKQDSLQICGYITNRSTQMMCYVRLIELRGSRHTTLVNHSVQAMPTDG